METVKVDLFPDEVYVFTPQGDVKPFPAAPPPSTLPTASTPRSAISAWAPRSTASWCRCAMNCKNGDTVEIITSPNHQPSKDWLKFVKTSRARTKIRQWIKAEARERSVDLGQEICEREFKKYHLDFSKMVKTEEMKKIVSDFSYQTVDDLMAEVGYGNISSKQIIGRLIPPEKLETGRKEGIPSDAAWPRSCGGKPAGFRSGASRT